MVRLCAAIYVSTAARATMSAIAAHASKVPRVAIVDNFSDAAYARSSLKLVGEADDLLEATRAAAAEALERVDLQDAPHPAPHPRVGAVDMVAFMPLSEASAEQLGPELLACDTLAGQLGRALGDLGCPVMLYGRLRGRSLLEARRLTSFFQSVRSEAPREVTLSEAADFGPAGTLGTVPQRSGVAVVGAMTYVTNFNIQVQRASLAECRVAATSLRTEMGVQVMALPHEGDSVEIGCNLQAKGDCPSPSIAAVLDVVRRNLPAHAVISRSYVVGLTPTDALDRAALVSPQEQL